MWLLLLLCIGFTAHAEYRFDVWTADNGLPQNIVRGIHQTPDGYLWIATLDGVARFDGVRFTIFNKSNTPGITSNRFVSMVGGRDGDLWLNTEGGGITRYHHGFFQAYGVAQGVPGNTVQGIAGDESGEVWILLTDTIAKWDEESGHFVDITPTSLRLPYRPLRWGNAGFWGWNEKGLHCFLKGRFVDYRRPARLPGVSIWEAAVDQRGTMWLETFDGKYLSTTGERSAMLTGEVTVPYVDRRAHSWAMHIGRQLDRSLGDISSGPPAPNWFSQLFEDREGSLWFGTEGQGLYRLQRQSVHVYSKEQGLVDRNIYPIYQESAGAVWIGAWRSGLSRFDRGKFTNYTMATGLPNGLVTALDEDRESRLWIATHGGLCIFAGGRFRTPEGPVLADNSLVQAIHQDREGTLWFGTSQGLVSYKNGATRVLGIHDGLATDDVRAIIESPSGDLWIGGYGGLTRLHYGQFTHWTERDGLPSNNVRSLYQDGDGVLWIGTYDNGLGRLKDGKLTRYTMHEGLFNNGVFQILEDARGNLWMSCNRGIYRVSKRQLNELAAGERKTITSVAYGKIDGMLNVECNGGVWPAGIKTQDGKMWFPTQDGVAVVDPETVTINQRAPPVVIESSLLDHTPVGAADPLQINPGKENLEIHYTALSFIKSEQIQFKYKMEGLDAGWIDAGPRRTAYYAHMPPGKYVFRVMAGNSDGVWNTAGQSLPVLVLAPFYTTWWFLTLAALAGASMLWALWNYRIAHLERAQASQQAFSQQLIASQETERKRIAAELHDSLGQRLVVINNLALFFLRAHGPHAEKNEQVQTVEEISAEAALAIEETRSISYNLRPFQLDRLGLVKAIEGLIRTVSKSSGMHFSTDLANIDDLFPEDLRINFYRIVQEALSNIMRHAHATEVSVRIVRDDEHVILSIRDNGRGFAPAARTSPSAHGGFGLTGMAERASLLGGTFKIRSEPGGGTLMTVEIPLGGTSHG